MSPTCASVDSPRLFAEAGGSTCSVSARAVEAAGWPTASALSGAQFCAGTNLSSVAKDGELTTPTNSTEVNTAANALLALPTETFSLTLLSEQGISLLYAHPHTQQERFEPQAKKAGAPYL
jgi:hypothetical protein